MKYQPYPYQQHATEHVLDNAASGLFLDMGLGKTVSTLTAICELKRKGEAKKVLIIAPLRVAESTWADEIAKWDHTRHLTLSRVLGPEKARKAALMAKADIYITNRENVPWLVAFYGSAFPFDVLIIDELSSFKSAKAARFKALRSIRPKVKRIIGLTGAPMPNGILDLWPQIYLLDQGERLGKTITGYRERYFTPGKRNGHVVYDYNLRKGQDDLLGEGIYEKEIYDKIGDICIAMKSEDYLDLPGALITPVPVLLPETELKRYNEFERKQVLALSDEKEVTAVNAPSLTGKLLQFAGGAVYDEEKVFHEVHGVKLEALAERVEAAQGDPVLICYWFKHERDRILQKLKAYGPRELKSAQDIVDWNTGKVSVMLGHPQSMGHGLNIQFGGHRLIWYGPIWSLELFLQANKRLDRQGQTKQVFIDVLIAKGTMDEDAMWVLGDKEARQEAMLYALKARIAKYR